MTGVLEFIFCRPFLCGEAALEQYRMKQEVGWLLWKQPGTVDVIGQLDREIMKLSYEDFPIESPLEVRKLKLIW